MHMVLTGNSRVGFTAVTARHTVAKSTCVLYSATAVRDCYPATPSGNWKTDVHGSLAVDIGSQRARVLLYQLRCAPRLRTLPRTGSDAIGSNFKQDLFE